MLRFFYRSILCQFAGINGRITVIYCDFCQYPENICGYPDKNDDNETNAN